MNVILADYLYVNINIISQINKQIMLSLKQVLLFSIFPVIFCEIDGSLQSKELTQSQAWGYGFLTAICLIVVTLIAEEIVMIIKHLISVNSFRVFLNLLYALACGTMIGDAILHSLPQAYTSPDTKVAIVGLLFLLSVFFFILMDRIFKYCGLTAQRWGTVEELFHPPVEPEEPEPLDIGSNHRIPQREKTHSPIKTHGPSGQANQSEGMTLSDHWQSISTPFKKLRQLRKKMKQDRLLRLNQQLKKAPQTEMNLAYSGQIKETNEGLNGKQKLEGGDVNQKESKENSKALRSFSTYQRRSEIKRITVLIQEATKREQEQEKRKEREENQDCFDRLKGKGMEGYLQIMMSFLHTFIDGFAIGVGFGTRDSNEYIPILVAVCTHAVPRQLGDIAILMKAGFDDCQTKVWAGIPKVSMLVGCAVGLGLQSTSQAAKEYIITIIAGTFIYLAADIWKSLFLTNDKCSNLLEFIVLALGIGMEFFLLLVEH